VKRKARDMEQHRQLELVRQAVSGEQAVLRLVEILAELRHLRPACLDRRGAARGQKRIKDDDQRHMGDHRPEDGCLRHESVPLAG